ncbi:kinase-like domain-containing protein [Glomus cerebriforme]|uniref:Kinase-like domain-containing protein n=1 Tax=Glomus cerebriforme TaxID=658196 RepID=A0A397T196_9GLOM|nr:kinase-like domain-containing protein [Glomus cerebriforme]
MNKYNKNLREYLQQNHNKLTWENKIKIINDITISLRNIHEENAIHRDLHSGNILYNQSKQRFCISDLGFCGPADKPLNSIYGNLPYIAPEVIRKGYTFATDIYSIGMLMWEISSGQPPFINYENDHDLDSFDQMNYDYNLAMKIINGPKIVSGTPLEYRKLMKQCWNADPTKRPNINKNKSMIKKLIKKIKKITTSEQTNDISSIKSNYTSTSRLFTSKVYQFTNLPEPRNATEEEQEVFHSNPYSFNIPFNIDDLNGQNDDNTSKVM